MVATGAHAHFPRATLFTLFPRARSFLTHGVL
jgi:hypothetical protein